MSAKKSAAVKPASKKTARPAATHPSWIEMIKVLSLLSPLFTPSHPVLQTDANDVECLRTVAVAGHRVFFVP
jgi:hypothetical protein